MPAGPSHGRRTRRNRPAPDNRGGATTSAVLWGNNGRAKRVDRRITLDQCDLDCAVHGARPATHAAAWYLQGIREFTDFPLVTPATSSASLQTSQAKLLAV